MNTANKKRAKTNKKHDKATVDWLGIILGLIVFLAGLYLTIGGGWLLALGGSWYFFLVGFGILISGFLLMRLDLRGVWIYFFCVLATFLWAIWDAGFDAWALVPRLVAPLIVLLVMLPLIPVYRKHTLGLAGFSAMRGRSFSLASASVVGILLLWSIIGFAQNPGYSIAPPEGAAVAANTGAPGATASSKSMAPAEERWDTYGGTLAAQRYSPANQITPENVSKLREIWRYRTGDLRPPGSKAPYTFQNTPLKIDNSLYLCTPKSIVISINAASGKENWRFDPKVSDEVIGYTAACRGVSYHHSADQGPCATRILFGTMDARLIALDAATGQLCPDFGNKGTVDLREGHPVVAEKAPGFLGITSAPTIVGDVAVVGGLVLDGEQKNAPSGVIRAFDVKTGKLRWAWDMARPDNNGLPGPGESYTSGTPNNWAPASADPDLGLVYLPLGNATPDYGDVHRTPVMDEYTSAMVALDVKTGKERWHYRTVNLDMWDYDLPSAGTLVDFPTGPGQTTPGIIIPTKKGEIFVLDRRTGVPLVQVDQKPAPSEGAPPEFRVAATQPYPSGMPDLLDGNIKIKESDLWGITPFDSLACRIEYYRSNYFGRYTPPSLRPFIVYPGNTGGSNWGGISVDPERNIMTINVTRMALRNHLVPRNKVTTIPLGEPGGSAHNRWGAAVQPQGGTPYGVALETWLNFTEVPCLRPPWGYIGAIDLTTRKLIWKKPFGTSRDNGPFNIPSMVKLPVGVPTLGGGFLTKSGLYFIASSTDLYLRAFDTQTGKELWSSRLPAGGHATPMTYVQDGRQYVVLAAGGHSRMMTTLGDYVIAYALE